MKSSNRILTDVDREELEPVIAEMQRLCPDVMARKIPDANVQQAFVLNEVQKEYKNGKFFTLSVGCFEDTAYEYLKAKETGVVGIDPEKNFDLHTYIGKTNKLYDIVFATSVLEHVEDDEQFLDDMCSLMKVGGLGILTMDFKNDYKAGDPVPYTDVRFYTRHDLEVRLKAVLDKNDCEFVDEPDWTGKDRFVYQGHNYSFATFVFRKTK